MTCANHNPIWIPSGHLCLACGRFYPAAGQELKPSYRTTQPPAPDAAAGNLFAEDEEVDSE